eukprot:TRINITY_DN25036_c0_g1_i1.p1 TRINITY_DN25036_c0_g1~~TRINITY_DN25036_c0_g1_i1.p1  ORF type:complete len:330 (+),score=54.25 TRINITY_DN25036_c0_g1_i1:74-1063(+)
MGCATSSASVSQEVQIKQPAKTLIESSRNAKRVQTQVKLPELANVLAESDNTDDADSIFSGSSAGSPFPPGPLQEGDFIWKPKAPIKIFSTTFGPVTGNDAAQFDEVFELRITHFLGSGAEGTVYKASCCCGKMGGTGVVAVKFAGAFADFEPNTHAALEMLVERKGNSALQVYQRGKAALQFLRPSSEEEWSSVASGPLRLVQYLGFHDDSEALLMQFCEGCHPESSDGLTASVDAFLLKVKEERSVEIGDIKAGNLIQNSKGAITIIDLGCCQYVGGAYCQRCNTQIACDIDVHATEHVAEYLQAQRQRVAVSRLRLQEFCYNKVFC